MGDEIIFTHKSLFALIAEIGGILSLVMAVGNQTIKKFNRSAFRSRFMHTYGTAWATQMLQLEQMSRNDDGNVKWLGGNQVIVNPPPATPFVDSVERANTGLFSTSLQRKIQQTSEETATVHGAEVLPTEQGSALDINSHTQLDCACC